MARARVSAATLKRLEAVERSFDEPDAALGGVMRVPPIMGLDEWEALAVPELAALAASAAEDIERHRVDHTAPFVHPMPAPVVKGQRTHPPEPHRKQEAVPMPPRPQKGLTR